MMAFASSKTSDILDQILTDAYSVANTLGYGFDIEIYQKALQSIFSESGLTNEINKPLSIKFKNSEIGTFVVDFLVENKIVILIKTEKMLDDADVMQCLNVLKSTGYSHGVVINFGSPKAEIRKISNIL